MSTIKISIFIKLLSFLQFLPIIVIQEDFNAYVYIIFLNNKHQLFFFSYDAKDIPIILTKLFTKPKKQSTVHMCMIPKYISA